MSVDCSAGPHLEKRDETCWFIPIMYMCVCACPVWVPREALPSDGCPFGVPPPVLTDSLQSGTMCHFRVQG